MPTIINAGKHEIILTDNLSKDFAVLLETSAYNNTAFIVMMDENTHRYCYPVLKPLLPVNVETIVLNPGEQNKNLAACEGAWKKLLHAGADRNAVIINLGGGMVTDIGGFIAATYKRGINFINIPTSLLGMVDASCGGKTGIDFDSFKNMVGVFAFPQTVIVDPGFLNTLPAKEIKNGMAEILKHALIADKAFWLELLPFANLQNENEIGARVQKQAHEILKKSIQIKADIVAKDPFEKNERKFLNFGHTIGHAIETWSLKNDAVPLSHGEAVAIGMVCESYLSVQFCGLSNSELQEISKVVKTIFSLPQINESAYDEILNFIKSDKKSDSGKIIFALLAEIGKPILFSNVDENSIINSLTYYNTL